MNFQEFCDNVAELLGEYPFWDDNALTLMLADGAEITLEFDENNDALHLYGPIAPVPPDRMERVSMELLKANLFCMGTGETGVIAYDSRTGQVMIEDKLPLSRCEWDNFLNHFYLLHLALLNWRRRVSELLSENGQTVDSSPFPGGGLRV